MARLHELIAQHAQDPDERGEDAEVAIGIQTDPAARGWPRWSRPGTPCTP